MNQVRILSTTGILGYGIPEESLKAGLERRPDVIACDAGSTDQGPSDLGGGTFHVPRDACHRDLRLMIVAARSAGIPVIVGSCGGAGADIHVDGFKDIVMEIAKQECLHLRLATIKSEQSKDYLRRQLRDGKIEPMGYADDLRDHDIDRSERIVAAMGVEPIINALQAGADVVLAGRATDTSLFSAVPVMRGFPQGPAWHAAKLLECGGAPAEPPSSSDCLFATIFRDSFVVEPPNEQRRCTPLSTAAHTLYENPSPYDLEEPSGTLDTRSCTYTYAEGSDRAVRVCGSVWRPASRYTVKLEGAAKVGYRAITIGGVRDPELIVELDTYLKRVRQNVAVRLESMYESTVNPADYSLVFHCYGRDGVMGTLEPQRGRVPHEVGLMILVTAKTQALAMEILAIARVLALHSSFGTRSGVVSNLAFPIAPSDIELGPAYAFTLNHRLELDDPTEPFATSFYDL